MPVPYLATLQQNYPFTFRFLNTDLHFRQKPCHHIEHSLRQLITNRRKCAETRTTAIIPGSEQSLFAKVQRLDSFKSKVRITLGTAQRNGRFDWPLEELQNMLHAEERGVETSALLGFGYTRSGLGLAQDYFLITQLLEDHIDGKKWLAEHPGQIETFIRKAFQLLDSLTSRNISHMDFWVGNLMQPTDGKGPLKAIDFENCFSRSTPYLSETLGFQLGFLYHREIYKLITEARYDSLVREFLRQKPTVSMDNFNEVYQVSKHSHLGRKERREVFLQGRLMLG
ncbi:hypothetical protein [Pseudomonas kilonensis]|uniref:hypothetical protein n=1 Tax=Pseudomonas kilonensis TaxID=132476 RepID=UPI0004656DE8|nr:hypothetical protein [Pseudomonas kilonensis]